MRSSLLLVAALLFVPSLTRAADTNPATAEAPFRVLYSADLLCPVTWRV